MDYISYAMGWILGRLSDLLGNNFAASVVAFTLLVNLCMLPLTLKSQKSTAKQAKLKPKLDALKKKYGNDKQKYSQAMNELYAKEKVSMSGGCLPMIIRMVVLMGVYWAVVSPLKFVQMVDTDAINSAKNWVSYTRVAESNDSTIDWNAAGLQSVMTSDTVIELSKEYGVDANEYFAKLIIVENANAMKKDNVQKGSVEEIIRKATDKSKVVREVELVEFLSADENGQSKYPVIAYQFQKSGGDLEDVRKTNFGLFGLDLTETPRFSWNLTKFEAIWLIPILSFATAMLSSIASMIMQKKINPDAPNMAVMMLMMPLFSLYIAFTVPGAVGFYWACSNVISGGLQILSQIVYGPNVIIAKEQAKTVIDRDKQEKARIAACTTPQPDTEEK
jgi:YidC/Oxa1 family membrane protein insertase